jgi:hypothetical protein
MERAEGAPSIWESVRGCVLRGKRLDRAGLWRQVVMPLYLRRAVAAAVAAKDDAAGVAAAAEKDDEDEGPLAAPLVVFVNAKSGGRHGPDLKVRLHELISEEQVMTPRAAPRITLVSICVLFRDFFASLSPLQFLPSYCLPFASLCFVSCDSLRVRFQWNFTAVGAET